MNDLQDKNWPRLDKPYQTNGHQAGWSLHQGGSPMSDADNLRSRSNMDMDDFMKDKADLIKDRLTPKQDAGEAAIPIESLHQHHKHHHHHNRAKDISPEAIDERVYDFVNDNILDE